jgi:hypothetical protein
MIFATFFLSFHPINSFHFIGIPQNEGQYCPRARIVGDKIYFFYDRQNEFSISYTNVLEVIFSVLQSGLFLKCEGAIVEFKQQGGLLRGSKDCHVVRIEPDDVIIWHF